MIARNRQRTQGSSPQGVAFLRPGAFVKREEKSFVQNPGHRLDTYRNISDFGDDKWTIGKKSQQKIYVAFAELGDFARSKKIKDCGSSLLFKLVETGERKLHTAFFCKDALCPVCSWRKSLREFAVLRDVRSKLEGEGYQFVHLTLTLKNMPTLEGQVSRLWGAFKKLKERKFIKKILAGYYGSLEFTWSNKGWHPHLHLLVALDKSIKLPMSMEAWTSFTRSIEDAWREITGDSFIIKAKALTAANTHEATKYVTKFETFRGFGGKERLEELAREIKGRKLRTKGGVMRDVADVDDVKDGDLIHVGDDAEKPGEKVVAFEAWEFDWKTCKYVKRIISCEEMKAKGWSPKRRAQTG